jgi:hypothetical protein
MMLSTAKCKVRESNHNATMSGVVVEHRKVDWESDWIPSRYGNTMNAGEQHMLLSKKQ